MPTAQQLAGDFSDTRLANGNLVPIYDPYNLTTNASGATRAKSDPGKHHSARAAESDHAELSIKYFPAPTSAGNRVYARQQLVCPGQHAQPRPQDRRQDRPQHFGQAAFQLPLQRRLGLQRRRQSGRQHLASTEIPASRGRQNFIIDYTRTQSPTTVITARAGVLRVKSVRDPLSTGFDATTLGLPAYMTAATGIKDFPACSRRNTARWASADMPSSTASKTCTSTPGSVTKIIGGHTIKAGAEFRKIQENYYQPNLPGGGFTFNRKQTGLNPLVVQFQPGRRPRLGAARLRQQRTVIDRLSHRPVGRLCRNVHQRRLAHQPQADAQPRPALGRRYSAHGPLQPHQLAGPERARSDRRQSAGEGGLSRT